MDFLQITTLAGVQGLTEFLPVSSSAHLVLTPFLFGWADQGIVFDIALHVGTLFAVVLYFWRDMLGLAQGKWDILQGKVNTVPAQRVWALAVATIPVVFAGLFLMQFVSDYARLIPLLAATSIGFGLLLFYADNRTVTQPQNAEITLKHALFFGIFQALAIIPGTSRSGACVTAGRLLGYNRQISGKFATLMAAPTIALSGLASLLNSSLASVNWSNSAPDLALGIFLSFLCGLAGIHVLMRLLTHTGYWPFVIYRVLLGVGLLVWYYT